MFWLLAYNTVLNIVLIGGLPVWLLLLLVIPKWRKGLGQKLGMIDPVFEARVHNLPAQGRVWIHTVSVGEFLATRPLIEKLLADNTPLVLSTTTATGQALAKDAYPHLPVFYFPLDLPSVLHKTLALLQPAVLVTVDTEIWPNLAWMAHQYGVQQLLINGRLSEKSFKGYAKLKPFFQWVLSHYSQILMQSQADFDRMAQLGAPKEALQIMGSMKYDGQPQVQAELVHMVETALGVKEQTPVIIFASTHHGEDGLFIDAFQQLKPRFPDLKALWVPRHPERFEEVANLLEQAKLNWTRRSQLSTALSEPVDAMLLDSMGELFSVFTLNANSPSKATVAVIGGSFVPVGGHNPLEPIKAKIPVLSGPEMFNFAAMTETLKAEDALVQIEQTDHKTQVTALANDLEDLFTDKELYAALVTAGQTALSQHQGATQRAYVLIQAHRQIALQTQAWRGNTAQLEDGSLASSDTSRSTSGAIGGR